MDEIRAVAPTGMLGSGFLESSLTKAMSLEPHFIACDAGSTDTGPDPLATGRGQFPRSAVKRDLRLMLVAACPLSSAPVAREGATSASIWCGMSRWRWPKRKTCTSSWR